MPVGQPSIVFFFQAEDGIRDRSPSRGLGDVYKRQNYAIIGRYILPRKIFSEIKKLKPGNGGEIHITDAIKNLIHNGNNFFGNIFLGKYLDCGTITGYIKSSIEIFKGKK